MFDVLQLPFIQRAFLIGAVSAVAFGLVGTFIVVRRIGYLAGAVAHTAFGGIGIGLYLQYVLAGTALAQFFPPLGVAVAVALLSAILVGVIKNKVKEREDTVIGVVWAVGMALGILLMNATPGSTNISNYLFGDIILNTPDDMVMVCILSAVVLLFVAVFFQRLEAVCFDEEFSRIRGVKTTFYFYLLLLLCALTVVLLVRIVGVILVIAMLTLPAAAACRFAHRLLPICALAVMFGIISTTGGLLISVCLNLSTGPVIVLTAAALYIAALLKPHRRNG
ncbi:MAG: metal ABC transporter permease [Planctomycetaceae bacterium]|jgi:zinc transport system permease protein|nr:metal ABC transporter permease [Planctomycetaceae bacterium]